MSISKKEEALIAEAKAFLENPNLLIRLASKLGQPLEALEKRLPAPAKQWITTATEKAMTKALAAALSTVPKHVAGNESERAQKSAQSSALHTLGATLAGGVGGLFGAPALIVELPFTTTLILRGIAEQAALAGFDLSDPQVQMECLYVFSLGGRSKADDAADTAYYSSRIGLTELMRQAAKFIAGQSSREILRALENHSAPALVQFIAKVAARFEIAVSQKFLAEAIPIVGAAGGAAVNSVFTHYFVEAAKFHFRLRALERKYGDEPVRGVYLALPKR